MLNLEDYRTAFTHIIALIVKYKQTVQYFRIFPNTQENFRQIMPTNFHEQGENDFFDILKDLETIIISSLLHWHHPQFHGYIPVGSNYISILSEIIVTGLGLNRLNWIKNDILRNFEFYVLDLLGRLLNLPSTILYEDSHYCGGGFIQNSESEAIYLCMLAARNRILNHLQKDPLKSPLLKLDQLVCYASQNINYDIIKIANLLNVKLKLLPTDDNESLQANIIEGQIRQDINNGLYPFFIIASIGTIECGAIDQLFEISKMIRKYRYLWYHITAPYAAPILMLPEFEYLLKGLQYIDSFDFCPFYWCLTTPNYTCLWVKRRKDIFDIFNTTEKFTTTITSKTIYNYSYTMNDYYESIIHHKGYDSIKLWFTLRCWGKRSLQNYFRNHITQLKLMEKMLKDDNDKFLILNKPIFGIICFSLKETYGHDPDKVTAELLNRLNTTGKIYLSGTILKGHFAIKCYLGNEYENKDDILNCVTIIRCTTEEILIDLKWYKPNLYQLKADSFIEKMKNERKIHENQEHDTKEDLQKILFE